MNTSALTPNAWEAAYLRFESPDQETRKFVRRLSRFGASRWPRDAQIVELFCGRGNGLRALANLGFTRVEGIDLSAALARQYSGPGRVIIGDCRHLPFENESRDVLIVQGGLHHLPTLPGDLETTLGEARRVLKRGGLFCAVEPWLTPFLSLVHWVCENQLARRLLPKIDALATMIEHERETYDQWLAQPQEILATFGRFFQRERTHVRMGKLIFVGHKFFN
ncbi:MAG: class I SAM-dependent methyltransferase [Verrucomicrobia subdivision 3 bacterium]|nr:class I SAM-dependent methyltransferase [Limisphaerales bacterium]